jgi:hypothetical protein
MAPKCPLGFEAHKKMLALKTIWKSFTETIQSEN